MTNIHFDKQGESALCAFTYVNKLWTPRYRAAVAEANTGTRYEATAIRAPWHSEDTWAVALFYPWQAAYFTTQGTNLHSRYFWKKMGDGRRQYEEVHGGDMAAGLRLIAELSGCDYTFDTYDAFNTKV